MLAGELDLAELVADHQLLDRRAAARRRRSTRRRSGSRRRSGCGRRRCAGGSAGRRLELGEDAADGRAGHAEAVALDERLAADRRRGRDVFLDDGPKDRLRAEVQGADGRRMRRAKGRSPDVVSTLRCESANGVAGIVAVAAAECQRGSARRLPRTGASDEPGEQLVREQPAAGRQDDPVVRRRRRGARPRAPSRTRRRAAARGRRRSGTPRVRAEPEDDALSAAAVAGSSVSAPPGGSRGGAAVGRGRARRRSRRDGRRSSAGSTPSNAWAPGPDRLVRPALPVGEVVAALVAGPRPVADLVAAPAGLGQAVRRRGGTARPRGPRPARAGRSVAPAARAARRRQVIALRARSGPRRPGRRGSARRARGGPARGRAPPRACRSRSPASCPGRRTGGPG